MKPVVIAPVLLSIPSLWFGRLMKGWTYQGLFDQPDIVVIGAPISSQDTKESGGLPGRNTVKAVGVATQFQPSVVIKGQKALLFRFTIIWERFFVIMREERSVSIRIVQEGFEPKTA